MNNTETQTCPTSLSGGDTDKLLRELFHKKALCPRLPGCTVLPGYAVRQADRPDHAVGQVSASVLVNHKNLCGIKVTFEKTGAKRLEYYFLLN